VEPPFKVLRAFGQPPVSFPAAKPQRPPGPLSDGPGVVPARRVAGDPSAAPSGLLPIQPCPPPPGRRRDHGTPILANSMVRCGDPVGDPGDLDVAIGFVRPTTALKPKRSCKAWPSSYAPQRFGSGLTPAAMALRVGTRTATTRSIYPAGND
jgi:hypothetical protein